MTKPLLLIGGYGVAGAQAARLIRSRNPDLPLVLAGRDPSKGKKLADELGGVSLETIDLHAPDLGLRHTDFAAMALFAKDHTGNTLEFAGKHAIPYLSLSSGAFEIGLDMTHGLVGAERAPIVLASHWFAGIAALAATHLAQRFASVDSVDVGVVIDRVGSESGPATEADFVRIISACPATLIRENGAYTWLTGDAAAGVFTRSDGKPMQGEGAVSCDVWSIGQGTHAPNVRVFQAFDESASTAAGGPASDEVLVRMKGFAEDGTRLAVEQILIGFRDSSPMTAVTSTILLEGLAGITEAPLSPGLYTVERAMAPARFMERVGAAGISVVTREM